MDRKLRDAIDHDTYRTQEAQHDRGMHADDRKTCWKHQCWAEECEGRRH